MFRFPVVRLAIFFVLGIAAQKVFGFAMPALWLLIFASALCFSISHIFSKARPKFSFLSLACGALLFGALGATSLLMSNEAHALKHYSNLRSNDGGVHVYSLTVREKLKSSKTSARYVCLVQTIDHNQSEGKVLFVLPKSARQLVVGDRVKAFGILKPLARAMNPGQFDYSAYLKNKGIFAQLSSTRIEAIGLKRDIWYFAGKLRTRILANVSKSGFGKIELPVFAALMLGQQNEIDAQVVRNYQYSGAVHVLSVSGLHLGFLMLLMQSSLAYFPNSRKWGVAKLALILLSLWGFAFVAGLSASVVRSAAMFSFVAIGRHLSKNTNIYNTLFASMLLILVIKPAFLFDVGFQLSYLAVFFIVWLKPIFDRYYMPKKRVTRYLADVLKVSFAAQIGTLPLSLFYFHQFPLLFFVTNLIVIPALGVIMSLGLLTLAWACCAAVPPWLGWLTCKSIWLLNEMIGKIASCESFVFKDIAFSVGLLVTSYVLIIAFGNFVQRASFARAVLFLIGIASVQCCFLRFEAQSKRTNELVVFQAWKQTLVTYKDRNRIFAFANDTSQTKIKFLVQPYAMRFKSSWTIKRLPNVLSFNKKNLLIIDRSGVYPSAVKPDYVLLCGSPKINVERLIKKTKPALVIADGSNWESCVAKWEQTCRKQKIPFHATAEKGSFIMKGAP